MQVRKKTKGPGNSKPSQELEQGIRNFSPRPLGAERTLKWKSNFKSYYDGSKACQAPGQQDLGEEQTQLFAWLPKAPSAKEQLWKHILPVLMDAINLGLLIRDLVLKTFRSENESQQCPKAFVWKTFYTSFKFFSTYKRKHLQLTWMLWINNLSSWLQRIHWNLPVAEERFSVNHMTHGSQMLYYAWQLLNVVMCT